MSRKIGVFAVVVFCVAVLAGEAFADNTITDQVMGRGKPIANSTVTLWEASAGPARQVAQSKSDGDGRFELRGSRNSEYR